MSPRVRMFLAVAGAVAFSAAFVAIVMAKEEFTLDSFPIHVLPDVVAADGDRIDGIFRGIFWLTMAIFVAVEAVLLFFLFRYARGAEPRKAHFSHGNNTIEIVWTIVPALICLVISLASKSVWSDVKQAKPAELKNPFVVDVSGRQFEWRIRYPNAKAVQGESYDAIMKRFARTDERWITKGVDNLFGIDEDDPEARDDIQTIGTLYVPVNRPVVVKLRSQDVLHSFFLPHFRVKQDAVPGWTIDVFFTPTKEGEWEIACAELCGQNHTNMSGKIIVLSDAELEKRLKKLLGE